jgi:uncharacterized protein (TIGR02118 family)
LIKLVIYGRRKKGMSLEDFDSYWEHDHGSLAKGLLESIGVRRYQQSMRLEANGADAFSASGATVADFFAELWFDDVSALSAAFSSPEGQAVLEKLALDEEKFIDRDSMASVVTYERAIIDGPTKQRQLG